MLELALLLLQALATEQDDRLEVRTDIRFWLAS